MREIFEIPLWPPLYVYRARHRCEQCGQDTDVIAIVAERYDEYYEGDPQLSEEETGPPGALTVVLVTPVVELPPPMLEAVRTIHPAYRRARMNDGTEGYANECACGAVIDDDQILAPGGALDMGAAGGVAERFVEVVVVRFPEVGIVRCNLREREAIELIHETWWRGVLDMLLQRLRASAKPNAAEHGAALARCIALLDQAREDLECWKKGEEPRLPPPPSDTEEEDDDAETEADFLAWEPLYLLRSEYACWRCSAVSPVFAIVAERYRDPWDDWTGDAAPHELKHVVRLSDIAQMSPELERVMSRVAPQIRIDFSKAAGVSYWMNHCAACGARFGDFFLGEVDGPFWATTPEEFEKKAIRFTVLPVAGPQRLRCGVTESGALEWMHDHWCRQLLSRLQGKLEHRGDAESSAFAAALERLDGEMVYLDERIELESARVYRTRPSVRDSRFG
jgi:hypothetical protein